MYLLRVWDEGLGIRGSGLELMACCELGHFGASSNLALQGSYLERSSAWSPKSMKVKEGTRQTLPPKFLTPIPKILL